MEILTLREVEINFAASVVAVWRHQVFSIGHWKVNAVQRTCGHWKYSVQHVFPGGSVVENPPANAGDTGSIPGPGRSHRPWNNEAHCHKYWAVLQSPGTTTIEALALEPEFPTRGVTARKRLHATVKNSLSSVWLQKSPSNSQHSQKSINQ